MVSQAQERRFFKSIKERFDRNGVILDKASFARIIGALSDICFYPKDSCSCGKPIIFLNGSKKFTCTRCGSVWELKIEVAQTKKPE